MYDDIKRAQCIWKCCIQNWVYFIHIWIYFELFSLIIDTHTGQNTGHELTSLCYFVKGIKNGYSCFVEIRSTQGWALVGDTARTGVQGRSQFTAQHQVPLISTMHGCLTVFISKVIGWNWKMWRISLSRILINNDLQCWMKTAEVITNLKCIIFIQCTFYNARWRNNALQTMS